MSRIGKNPVLVPESMTYSVSPSLFEVKGKLGSVKVPLKQELVAIEDINRSLLVKPVANSKLSKAMQGTIRSLIANAVKGVDSGFEAELEIVGVGYKCAIKGSNLVLNLGFSHEVVYPVPEDVKITCAGLTIKFFGMDKQRVVQTAAKVKAFKPPEPYKGKGIRFKGQFVLRKEGKKK